jgi:hypothetical protein
VHGVVSFYHDFTPQADPRPVRRAVPGRGVQGARGRGDGPGGGKGGG